VPVPARSFAANDKSLKNKENPAYARVFRTRMANAGAGRMKGRARQPQGTVGPGPTDGRRHTARLSRQASQTDLK
jgi:hypothetical protein